ncbi:hypothetical protein ACWDOR_01550 [Streptosporangium canum]
MCVADLFEEEESCFPVVVLQVLQHAGHIDVGLGPDAAGTELSSFQQRGILEIHGLIVPGHGVALSSDTF